jgi:hypothetical protein
MPKGDGYGGQPARHWVRAVLDTYGTTCHLCQHQGADSGDHLQPRSTHPQLMYVTTNGRPVHHKPCPVCGVRCNIRRKDKPLTVVPRVRDLSFFKRHP